MTIKTTVAEERAEIEQLGVTFLRWYDIRIEKINTNTGLIKEEKRKRQRSIYTRTMTKFVKDTQSSVSSTVRKPRAKKNARTDYSTFEEFLLAVKEILPPIIDKKAMEQDTFYVWSLKAFYEDSQLPPTYFVDTFTKRWGEPLNSILLYQGELPLLALGAVPISSG